MAEQVPVAVHDGRADRLVASSCSRTTILSVEPVINAV